ncbi:MAG: hypothetical protein ACI35W_02760 [Anaeroplasmataceae bacterium]
MIKRMNTIMISIIYFLSLAILIKSNCTNRFIGEYTYAIRYDYSFIYTKNRTMTINLYSNIENPSFSYIDRNIYSLQGENDFYYILDIKDIKQYCINDMYRYELIFDLPALNQIYINSLELNIENDYYLYNANIGTLYIDEIKQNDINIKTFYAEFDNNLSKVIIELNEYVKQIDDINISPNINNYYELKNNIITIYLNSNNLIDNLFIDLSIDNKTLFIDNYYYATLELDFNDVYSYTSVLNRRNYSDSI